MVDRRDGISEKPLFGKIAAFRFLAATGEKMRTKAHQGRLIMKTPVKIAALRRNENGIQLNCKEGTLEITPYGDNIVHIAYYPQDPAALPMWGIEGKPAPGVQAVCEETPEAIWYRMPELTLRIDKKEATLDFTDRSGQLLTQLIEYSLTPVRILGEDTWQVRAVFSAQKKEHYYGLGQHQDGRLDLGGKEYTLWHDYSHKGGEIVAVPFLVTNRGYAILFENTSRMKVAPGVAGKTVWEAEVGDAVSFFLICGKTTDALYTGYRTLCGNTPLPPRSGLGFIQSKQRYASQQELLEVARTYKEKGYPCDIFVVDWFHWKTLGDMSLNEEYWPDPKGMNEALHAMGYETMISCWPRFMKESRHYKYLEQKGWFMKDAEGNTVYGNETDHRGALIDTTNPECGEWYMRQIEESYEKQGFSYWWTDENEPDISPHESYLSAGTGARVHNLYPLTHSKCIWNGHRARCRHRCLILSRAAYLGAQKYGTTFWSSDVYPEWDVLKRQIPTALNFCASGMPYWSSDIGGWQPLPDTESGEDYNSLLIGTSSTGTQVKKQNYAELYIRWFQFGAFCPTFRTHGTRKHNEVWSYGEKAEQILVKYLKLRYSLMPYIYSLAYQTTRTGAPFMRALWMDFPEEECARLQDEFMFGPAFLIAPVVECGQTQRRVYLPQGADWVDYWTGRHYRGGRWILAQAQMDCIPIFVRAGSIIPVGEDVESLQTEQKQIEARVYPGADCSFTLYSDDGKTYDYEKGVYDTLELRWDNCSKRLTANGTALPLEWCGKTIMTKVVVIDTENKENTECVTDA